jgi:phytoene/squalene synthetase
MIVDLLVRLWRLLAARLALRRAAPLRRLAAIADPHRFARGALVASGRRLSLAVALLPRDQREEAALAYLACRALDAHEDLAPDPASARAGLLAVRDYLCGHLPAPPPTGGLFARCESDAVEVLIAARLPLLREGLARLPPDRRQRVEALIDDVAAAMARALARRIQGQPIDLIEYCDGVLGRAVAWAIRLATGAEPPPLACRAAGRVLQIANHVRDAEADAARGARAAPGSAGEARGRLLLRAASEAALVPRLLRALAFPRRSGARGAAALMALSTAAFFLRFIGLRVPRAIDGSLVEALRAAISPVRWRQIIATLEAAIANALPAAIGKVSERPSRGDPAAERPPSARRAFEEHLADAHPDPAGADALAATAALLDRSSELTRGVGDAPLTGAPAPDDAAAILAGDHLYACALAAAAPLGPSSVRDLGELTMRLAARAQATGATRDDQADVAVFLSRNTGRAAGLRGPDLDALGAGHRAAGRALHALDVAPDRSERRAAARALAALPLDGAPASTEVRARLERDLARAKAIGGAP